MPQVIGYNGRNGTDVRQDLFGINMRQWCRNHEEYLRLHVQNTDPRALLDWHMRKLSWLQHERLVHLIVTFLTTVVELTAVVLMLLLPTGNGYAALVALGILVLLSFYLAHYFFLENTVQHWYRLADELHDKAAGSDGNTENPHGDKVTKA
ncbi:hypothetical protein [uncultured Bifidobacterium sp.]|uniref:hypothetical protein n=1 Tax=uncultured Bifidobacterium sp. TaxID=165187 RepID=UPI0028DB1626|nr:hypothetical protein [uncultured Bifidobacterium sp.]